MRRRLNRVVLVLLSAKLRMMTEGTDDGKGDV